jgi:short-subunit dehydrogenase
MRWPTAVHRALIAIDAHWARLTARSFILLKWWLRRRWRADNAALAQWVDLSPAVVVTGASEGIGLAIARRFAAAGNAVVLIARRPQSLEEAAEAIRRDLAADVAALALDVTRADAAEVLERELTNRGLYADVLVNNAGIGLSGAFACQTPDAITQLVALNVRALTDLMRHFLPAMCVRGRGGVLNVASLGAYVPGPYQAAYYASKAYVVSLTEAVAWETRGLGVRVAVAAPGPVRTRFLTRMDADNAFYRLLFPAPGPEWVARSAVWGFRWGRTVIGPGLFAPLMVMVLRVIPHVISIPILGWLLKPRTFLRPRQTE